MQTPIQGDLINQAGCAAVKHEIALNRNVIPMDPLLPHKILVQHRFFYVGQTHHGAEMREVDSS